MALPPDHARLLAAAGEELTRMRATVDGVEALVSALIAGAAAQTRAQALIGAQNLDLLNQRLDGLSRLLAGLAAGDAPHDVLARVTLADMAERLAGPAAETAPNPDNGDLILF